MSKARLKVYSGVFGASCLTLAMGTAPAQAGCRTNVSNVSGFNHANMGGYRPQNPNHHNGFGGHRPGGWNGSNMSGGNPGNRPSWWNGSNSSGSNPGQPAGGNGIKGSGGNVSNYPNPWNGSNSSGNNFGNQSPWTNTSNSSGSNTNGQPGWTNTSNSSGSNTNGQSGLSNGNNNNTVTNPTNPIATDSGIAGDSSKFAGGSNGSNSSGNRSESNSGMTGDASKFAKSFSGQTDGSATNPFVDSNPFAAQSVKLQQSLGMAKEKYNQAVALLAAAENAEAQNAKLVANARPVRYSRINGDLADCGCINPDTASTPSANLLAAKATEASAAAELNQIKAEIRQFLEAANNYRSQIAAGSTYTPIW